MRYHISAAGSQHAKSWLLVCGLAMAAPGCVSLCRNPVSDDVVAARQMSLEGIEAMEQGHWDEAEALFAGAIETYPADERSHRRYAELLWRRGDRDTAILHMEQSLRLSGGDPKLVVRLGEMHLSHGNVSSAERRAEQAIAAHRHCAAAWALRGDVQRQKGAFEQAMVSYHRALSLQEHYPHVQVALAEIYQQQRRFRRSLATLDALAGQMTPGEVPRHVHFLRGLALKEQRRYADAVEALVAAASHDEPDVEVLYQLGEARWLAGDVTNARLAVQAALARAPHHEPSRQLQQRLDQQQQSLTAAR